MPERPGACSTQWWLTPFLRGRNRRRVQERLRPRRDLHLGRTGSAQERRRRKRRRSGVKPGKTTAAVWITGRDLTLPACGVNFILGSDPSTAEHLTAGVPIAATAPRCAELSGCLRDNESEIEYERSWRRKHVVYQSASPEGACFRVKGGLGLSEALGHSKSSSSKSSPSPSLLNQSRQYSRASKTELAGALISSRSFGSSTRGFNSLDAFVLALRPDSHAFR